MTTIISSNFTINTYIMCRLINGYDCVTIPKTIEVLKYSGDLNGTVYNICDQDVEMVIREYNLMTGTPTVGLTACDEEEIQDCGDKWEVYKFDC